MRNRKFFDSNLSSDEIVGSTIALLIEIGESELNRRFVEDRAARGWCVAEIARSYIRAFYPKGDRMRRQFLVALTRAGAPAAI